MEPDVIRIDQWLWAARFFKTRSLARQAVAAGRVEVGGAPCKPSREVRVGDQVVVQRDGLRFEVRILGVSRQRGPAPVAQALYVEDEAARQRREEEIALRRAERAGYRAPEGRPDKRARRLIRALGDIDSL
jgi:ribosome-associated heat shock protein Hsp15